MVKAGSLNMNTYAKTTNGNSDDNTLRVTLDDDGLKVKTGMMCSMVILVLIILTVEKARCNKRF